MSLSTLLRKLTKGLVSVNHSNASVEWSGGTYTRIKTKNGKTTIVQNGKNIDPESVAGKKILKDSKIASEEWERQNKIFEAEMDTFGKDLDKLMNKLNNLFK